MSDSIVRKGPSAAPLSPKVVAHRKRQKKMIRNTAAVIVLGVCGWWGYAYYAGADDRVAQALAQGEMLLSPGHYAEAIPHFERALEIDANSWTAYYKRAVARQNLNQIDTAVADYNAALSIKTDLVEARSALATIYRDKGERQRAIQELTAAIQIKPTTDSYFQRGATYQELGQHQQAIDDFTWVIQAMRDAPWVYFARAHSKRAMGDTVGAAEDEATAETFDRSRQK